MSRTEARQKIPVRSFEKSMRNVWFDRRMTRRLVDEAPTAYKDVDQVMRDQKDLVAIIQKLRPVLSFKGS